MYSMVPYRNHSELTRPMMTDLFNDRFFRNFFDIGDVIGSAGFRVDVREQDDAYILEAELPGVKSENVTLTAEDDVLTIAADLNMDKREDRGNYLYSERHAGHMERRFNLEGIRQEDITATCHDGVLVMTMPKANPEPAMTARKIEIQ